jgi:hypothetical protein
MRRVQPDRGKIDMSDDDIVTTGANTLASPALSFSSSSQKVGNSVQAVEKELKVERP